MVVALLSKINPNFVRGAPTDRSGWINLDDKMREKAKLLQICARWATLLRVKTRAPLFSYWTRFPALESAIEIMLEAAQQNYFTMKDKIRYAQDPAHWPLCSISLSVLNVWVVGRVRTISPVITTCDITRRRGVPMIFL